MRGALQRAFGASEPSDGLPGSPAQHFQHRLARRGRTSAAALDFLTLATGGCLAVLLGRSADGTAGWQARQIALVVFACLAAASLANHCLAAGRSPSNASLQQQQLLSLLLRLGLVCCEGTVGLMALPWRGGAAAAFGGAGGELQAADEWLPWLAALLYSVLQLLVSSSALCMLLQGLRRIPISLSIPMHLLMLAVCSSRTADACAAGPLASPAAQRSMHQLYSWLHPMAFCALLPLSLLTPQDAAGECRAMLRFLQAFLGTVVPLAWQAIAESRLFAQHQAQRRAAHLPPERGADAAILSAVHGLLHEAVRPYLYIFGVFLTGSLWDWSCLLSAPEPAPAPAPEPAPAP